MKYVNEFLRKFGSIKFPTFTKSDAYLFLNQYGVSNNYAKRFLNNLVRSRHIYHIKRNYYTVHKSLYAVGFAFPPFYYGLGTALNIHNLSEQQSIPTVISASKTMPKALLFMDKKIFIHRINIKMFFGVTTVLFDNIELPVSDIEKTLMDLIYFRYGVEDYVYENIFKQLNKQKINGYLKNYNRRVRAIFKALERKYT